MTREAGPIDDLGHDRWRIRVLLFVTFSLLAASISALMALAFYHHFSGEVRRGVRTRLRDAVALGATLVDAADHDALTLPEQENGETYCRVQKTLRRVRDTARDIHYVYTMRAGEHGEIVFVVDAETNEAEVAHLGDAYHDASDLLKARFSSLDGPVVESDFYTDRWGTWLTGYAPFYAADGRRVGVMGMDIKADDVVALQRRAVIATLSVFLTALPLCLLLGWFLGKRLSEPVKALTAAAQRLAGGDLECGAPPSAVAELDTLGKAFNTMAARLRNQIRDLQVGVEEKGAALDRKTDEEASARAEVDYRLALEDIVARVSSKFAGSTAIDERIDETLQAIGDFCDVDRAYLFLVRPDGITIDNTHEWCAEVVEPQVDELKGIKPADELPWFWGQLLANRVIHVADVGVLRPEAAAEKTHWEQQGIQSLLVVPMTADGSLIGFLGFDSVRAKKSWPEDIISLLRITGETIARAMVSRRAEQGRAQIEAQLRQTQKLKSIGTLAGGVAHEINNPINGIMNYAQLIKDRTAQDDTALSGYADEIIRETERVASIVRNLLSFARRGKQSSEPVQVQELIERTLSLIRTIMRHDQITLHEDITEGLPFVSCRDHEIQQVLMNLFTNARDALNAKYVGFDERKITTVRAVAFERDGVPWVRVTVEDSGAGIPDETRERIFDPFFSTKPKDEGTGLGLAISYGIVKDHGGELWVESGDGGPTRFHMDLPVNGKRA